MHMLAMMLLTFGASQIVRFCFKLNLTGYGYDVSEKDPISISCPSATELLGPFTFVCSLNLISQCLRSHQRLEIFLQVERFHQPRIMILQLYNTELAIGLILLCQGIFTQGQVTWTSPPPGSIFIGPSLLNASW